MPYLPNPYSTSPESEYGYIPSEYDFGGPARSLSPVSKFNYGPSPSPSPAPEDAYSSPLPPISAHDSSPSLSPRDPSPYNYCPSEHDHGSSEYSYEPTPSPPPGSEDGYCSSEHAYRLSPSPSPPHIKTDETSSPLLPNSAPSVGSNIEDKEWLTSFSHRPPSPEAVKDEGVVKLGKRTIEISPPARPAKQRRGMRPNAKITDYFKPL